MTKEPNNLPQVPARRDRRSGMGELPNDHVIETIRNAILDGDIAAGSRINEGQLAQRLAVSRTPIRAALHVLAGEGLITYIRNRGYFVREFDLSEVLDAFEMRALAEAFSARLAAERGLSAHQEVELDESLQLTEEALQCTDIEQARHLYSRSNELFHTVIQSAAGSRLVSDVIALCHRIPQTLTRNVMAFTLEDVRKRGQEHRLIYEAILARRPKEAEERMFDHVIGVRKGIVRALAAKDQPPRDGRPL